MLYHPQNRHIWDAWCFPFEGELHAIHLQYVNNGVPDPVEEGSLWHAATDDLIHWRTLPTALYPGVEPGSVDDRGLWTGCVVEKDGLLYLFYTARSSAEDAAMNRIALATSSDANHWRRYEGNPLFIPDKRWYANEHSPLELYGHGHFIVDCRDLCVVRDPEGGGYWGFFAARKHARTNADTSVIGLCHSDDLLHWTQYAPCFEPPFLACVEVPDVFYLNGKWYMLCLTGNEYGHRGNLSDPLLNHATIYAVADDVRGPYRMLDENVLIGSARPQGYSAKTVIWQEKRVMFYTQRGSGAPESYGSISAPHILDTDDAGRLIPRYHHACDKWFVRTDPGKPLDVSGGLWGSIGDWEQTGEGFQGNCPGDWAVLPFDAEIGNGSVAVTVSIFDARSAGIALHLEGQDIMRGGVVVFLDARERQVVFTRLRQFPLMERRHWPVERGRRYRLKVLMLGGAYLVYVDDILALQLTIDGHCLGKSALFVEHGGAHFTDIVALAER